MNLALLTGVAAAALPLPAYAIPGENPDPLPEVVVTATRLSAIAKETPGARVIDRGTLERRGAVFAADILADVPGLSVVRSGAFGGVAQVRMRGASPGQTLVLVDGVPLNDPAEINGAFDFSGFELSDIERIEVLSGPQSSLWGSDAIGGVIAFTTRDVNGFQLEAEGGSFGSARGRIAAGAGDDRRAFSAWMSRYEIDGVSAADARNGNPEADGLRRTAAGVKARLQPSDRLELDGSFRWSDSQADLDGFPAPLFVLADTGDVQTSEQWSGSGGITASAFGLRHRLLVSSSSLDRETAGETVTRFQGDRLTYRWQADGSAQELSYAFGAERSESSGSLSSGASEELVSDALFGVARWSADALTLTGGLRLEDTQDFGSETTGRASAAWSLAGGLIVSAAWGTGFKAPSISQAVCDYCYAPEPWPILRPERADSLELALGWTSADGRAEGRATVYRLNVTDQISYVSGQYINVDQARSEGLELEGRLDLPRGFDLALAYAWTRAKDRTTGMTLLRTPEHAGSATLGWSRGRLATALTVRAEGDQADSENGLRVTRPGFITANLNAGWDVSEAVRLTLRLENLSDESYQQVFGYGEPGRAAYLGLRLRY